MVDGFCTFIFRGLALMAAASFFAKKDKADSRFPAPEYFRHQYFILEYSRRIIAEKNVTMHSPISRYKPWLIIAVMHPKTMASDENT